MYGPVNQQRCTGCDQVKPADDFYRSSKARRGLQARCKACHSAAVRRYRDGLRQAYEERGGPAVEEKRCPRCHTVKSADDFHRNRSTTDGLHWVCARCNTSSTAARHEAEERRRFGRYGIDRPGLLAMLDDQDRRCAVCRQPSEDRTPHIDHCHSSGIVRGLLCMRCNTAIGLLGDDPTVCLAAAHYLTQRS